MLAGTGSNNGANCSITGKEMVGREREVHRKMAALFWRGPEKAETGRGGTQCPGDAQVARRTCRGAVALLMVHRHSIQAWGWKFDT